MIPKFHKINRLWVLLCIIAPITCFVSCHSYENKEGKLKRLYSEVDEEIQKVEEYDAKKERRINVLKERLANEKDSIDRSEIIDDIIEEYEAFISDSALYYINLNLENPYVRRSEFKKTDLLIKKADVAAHAGLFLEAGEILGSIDRRNLSEELLEKYYSAYCDLYQYQTEYSTDSEYSRAHSKLREAYNDSVSMIANPNSINYIINHSASDFRKGNYDEAEEMLQKSIFLYQSGEREYSIIASLLAELYRNRGDKKKYNEYLCYSVVSDLRGAIKENMAIRALATECYESGDIERANRYLRQSFADANFYAARMRNAQSSQMLPIIGEAYSDHQSNLNHKLTLLVIFISLLAFGFILIAVFALMQMHKIRKINKKTKNMLEEVSTLSDKLAKVNKELSDTNEALTVSNNIRWQYGVLFMEYCSMAISSLQQYQNSLKVAVAQGDMKNLIKKIESVNFENKTVAEFYSKFDEAILNLYPNFVEKVNALLKPEEKIVIGNKETLNTELRILALIRIGIQDSDKIAKFLRCSLTTVYTYRCKIKKKSLDPDKFEENLMRL